MDTQVLIAGAGPVGLTLAIDLAQRGIRSILVERNPKPMGLPKMERCNARTMEIYRKLGLADRIRAAGYPADAAMDVFIVTTVVDEPILRHPYPSVNQARERIAACTDGSQPLEPYQLISQYTLEPLLRDVADNLEPADIRFGRELLSVRQDADGVTATVKTEAGEEDISAEYLVGCDGGSSTVRKQLGIKLEGDGNLLNLRQALIRCDELYDRIPIGKGRHYHVADDKQGFLITQDDTRHFTLHSVVEKDEDMATEFERIVAMPVDYEILYVGEWTQHLLLAERYRDGRAFIAGDACHLVPPTGGLGMNTGVGDAINLGWKLAATLKGFGGDGLLDSYETERRAIGAINVGVARRASEGRQRWRNCYRLEIADKTPEGAAAREHLAEVADDEQRKTNQILGAELGYIYRDSPVVAREPGDGPDSPPERYVPTAAPGARLPSTWLADGSAVQDAAGPWYTVLRIGDDAPDGTALLDALRTLGAPAESVVQPDIAARKVYGASLLLLRPDLHVVWRGTVNPDDPISLAALATGNG
ncbi:MAG: FAD-dependent monooxygenase [Proteobacteria bacterium]|nr:FAD-dependent monooxygenase [Pseudomonadota bacterium]